MVLTPEELEIVEFYRDGMTVLEIVEATGYTRYKIKKLLANEPEFSHYFFRHLKDWKK